MARKNISIGQDQNCCKRQYCWSQGGLGRISREEDRSAIVCLIIRRYWTKVFFNLRQPFSMFEFDQFYFSYVQRALWNWLFSGYACIIIYNIVLFCLQIMVTNVLIQWKFTGFKLCFLSFFFPVIEEAVAATVLLVLLIDRGSSCTEVVKICSVCINSAQLILILHAGRPTFSTSTYNLH